MTTQQMQEVPEGWPGSLPEYVVYRTLEGSFGKRPDIDFTYQSPLLGGRLEKAAS